MKKINKGILIPVILLIIISLFMIYSSSFVWANYKFNNPYKYVLNQSLFVFIGFIILIIISKIDYKLYYKKSNLLLVGSIFLLVIVLFIIFIHLISNLQTGQVLLFLSQFMQQPS